jgi:mono/diheme cytochrome c family protein
MIKNSTIISAFILLVAWSCKSVSRSQTGESEGLSLMEKNCYSCHSPDASLENRLAPPMVAVKMHYKKPETSKADFVNSLVSFVKNPEEVKTKMPGAVKRFGVMPKVLISDEKLQKIAIYLYENDPPKPEWFDDHHKKEQQGEMGMKNEKYGQLGQKYASETQQVLGKNLMQAMSEGGSVYAVEFCNTQAYPLTDSMAMALDARIKRVSDKARNPENKANMEQLDIILKMKAELAAGKQPKPAMVHKENKVLGHYPIVTKGLCLSCHGSEVNGKLKTRINELYPADEATGYEENELRGLWVVEMDKK